MSGHCDFCGIWHSGSCCHPGRAKLASAYARIRALEALAGIAPTLPALEPFTAPVLFPPKPSAIPFAATGESGAVPAEAGESAISPGSDEASASCDPLFDPIEFDDRLTPAYWEGLMRLVSEAPRSTRDESDDPPPAF
jgi:hypothetical protein